MKFKIIKRFEFLWNPDQAKLSHELLVKNYVNDPEGLWLGIGRFPTHDSAVEFAKTFKAVYQETDLEI